MQPCPQAAWPLMTDTHNVQQRIEVLILAGRCVSDEIYLGFNIKGSENTMEGEWNDIRIA